MLVSATTMGFLLAMLAFSLLLLLLLDCATAAASPSPDERASPSFARPDNSLLAPVVLVPGSAGNQLYAKLTDGYASRYFVCRLWRRASRVRLWLDVLELVPPFTRCFAERIALVYNRETDRYEDARGVEAEVPFFGSTRGMMYLDPNFRKLSVYMDALVESLQAEGYVDNKSLLGAPYDFRYAPGKHAAPVANTFLEHLKILIEQAYLSNGEKKVVLVSHSLGGLWVLYFLNQQMLSWRQKYVKRFIAISTPWGGTVQEMRTFASGYAEGIPILSPLLLRKEQRNFESNLWLMPVASVFGNHTLVITPKKAYSSLDLPAFFNDIGYSEGFNRYESRIPALTKELESPGIPVTLIFSHKIATPITVIYGEKGFDEQPKIVTGDGDGTVNLCSLSAVIEKWNRTAGQALKVITFSGKTHKQILTDNDSVGVILDEIMGRSFISRAMACTENGII